MNIPRSGMQRRDFGVGRSRRMLAAGFTMIELLTVIAIIAVLATMLLAAIAGTQKSSRQTVCRANLRQIVIAAELYLDETGRRPRSVSHLTGKPAWLGTGKVLRCPHDPFLRGQAPPSVMKRWTNAVGWGNFASPTQEPEGLPLREELEEGSFSLESEAKNEYVAFSYLHSLGWRKSAWQKLGSFGNQYGLVVCQLHGLKVAEPRLLAPPDVRPFLTWEGATLRSQRDGSVVTRRIFHSGEGRPVSGAAPGALIPYTPAEYPFEYYSDRWAEMRSR